MPITQEQKSRAEAAQYQAAHDASLATRVVAGPGTGKSHTTEERVCHALMSEVKPENIYVISFTRATCKELSGRIIKHCGTQGLQEPASGVHISTMHSLALSILRRANLLKNFYPSEPKILDSWEQRYIYDEELSSTIGSNITRASQIRIAHDARWQTLDEDYIDQSRITDEEKRGFNSFNRTRTHLYSCVLPGEVIFRCVEAVRMGEISLHSLPKIEHLIVDEFQDLNACDQEFVRIITESGAALFVAGDDDQSIYLFRHADPTGIIDFDKTYPASTTHTLTECFRCTPAILSAASRLISHNPTRLTKDLHSLYSRAKPPVQGSLQVWSFSSADEEAAAIAQSCQALLSAGMAGEEDEIVVLIARRKPTAVQLDPIARELANLGLPFSLPGDPEVTSSEAIRAVYSLLRITRDCADDRPDYPAHRALLGLLSRVGGKTAKAVSDACVANAQDFHGLFYLDQTPRWLDGRCIAPVMRVASAVAKACQWHLTDTLSARQDDIEEVLTQCIWQQGNHVVKHLEEWRALAGSLPDEITLEELLEFLDAATDDDQALILGEVNRRLGAVDADAPRERRIRILTMHGAKGLSGKIVFIPGAEQGIVPSFRALKATGLVIEQRRLFYVSLTRAKAACIVTHSARHSGAAAMALEQRSVSRLTRSQFLNEMEIGSTNRGCGLTTEEAKQIVADAKSL